MLKLSTAPATSYSLISTDFSSPTRHHTFENPEFLIHQLSLGENRAVHFLMEKMRDAVHTLCKQRGLPSDAPQTILHDSVLIFIQKIKEGKYVAGAAPPHAFAFRIATFLAKNSARRLSKRRFVGWDEAFSDTFITPCAEYLFIKNETTQTVHQALQRISTRHRQLLQLRYFEGLHDEEIVGQRLTPYSTAKSLKVRRNEALNALRRTFLK